MPSSASNHDINGESSGSVSVDLCYCSKCGRMPKLTQRLSGTWVVVCETLCCIKDFSLGQDRNQAVSRWNEQYGEKPGSASPSDGSPAPASSTKPDWRIGLKVKPKFRTHALFGRVGTIVEVQPDGFRGVKDTNGVLIINMGFVLGFEVIQGANEWVTA